MTPNDFEREYAARCVVVASTLFVPHCGYCGKPMQACVCGTKPAKDDAPKDDVQKAEPPPPDKEETWRDRPPLL
jgi:hypothetical protein